jgi:hypothetical protein
VDASAADLPKEVAAKAWPNAVFPDGDLRYADLEIRALAAAARCITALPCTPCPLHKPLMRCMQQTWPMWLATQISARELEQEEQGYGMGLA